MSILLESLSRETPKKDNGVPDIHANHFDDEMMSDDWLIRRVQKWRIIASLLLFGLIASWIFFFFYVDSSLNQALVAEQKATNDTSVVQAASTNSNEAVMTTSANDEASDIESASTIKEPALNARPQSDFGAPPTVVKQNYQPKKREPVVTAAQSEQAPKVESALEESAAVSQSETSGATLALEELSDEMKSQFPNIEINSYVVADTRADSFVILDGGFYKIDQVIAPGLILRDITQDAIVVEFRSQRVKIPNK